MKSLSLRIYRRLAFAFPHEFQMVYGSDIVQTGEEAIDFVWKRFGILGLMRLLADIAWRLPAEYLAEMRRDVVYAFRTLLKSRGFATVGILSLGLGIGVASFSASEFFNLVFRDAPGVTDADNVAMVMGTSYPAVERYREQHKLFSGVAAFQGPEPFNVSLNEKPERVYGHLVSPDYFAVLGVRAARGRVFDRQIDRAGSAPVVFISDAFWRHRMDSDPDAVGRTIHVNGQVATVVGVGPKDFAGVVPVRPAEIFVPITSPAAMVPELAGDELHQRATKVFQALFRLAPGVTTSSAEAGLDTVTRQLEQEWLDPARSEKGRRIRLLPGGKMVPMPRELLPVEFGMALLLDGLIIGLAAMNLANMQLARATARRREVAVRLSVGASRFRLLRQLLTESILLACFGGLAGIAAAYGAAACVKFVRLPVSFPVNIDVAPDWRVLAFAFVVSLAAGIGFGLFPALASTRTDLVSTLKEGSMAHLRGYRRFGIRNLLMAAQVAGALMLLLITGFMMIGSQKNNLVEVPFDSEKMVLLSIDPVRDGYTAEKAAQLFEDLPGTLKRAPGVEAVALAEAPPFGPVIANATLAAPAASGQTLQKVAKQTVGANYFRALSDQPFEGREFEARDERMDAAVETAAIPVVLNEMAARKFFGSPDAVGRRLQETSRSYEVIGVVKDLAEPFSDSGDESEITNVVPTVYLPLTRSEFGRAPSGGMTILVRTGRAADTMEGVRRKIAGMDANVVIFNVRTLTQQVDRGTFLIRLITIFYGSVGVFGLILAAIGLAGVTAYSVARRRKEIGIRVAIGASQGQVLRLVMREGGALVLVGSVLGFLGAVVVSRGLGAISTAFGQSFAAGSHDLRLIVGAPLLLAGLAMLACYVPARRSMRIDPLDALRDE